MKKLCTVNIQQIDIFLLGAEAAVALYFISFLHRILSLANIVFVTVAYSFASSDVQAICMYFAEKVLL